ncbi:hypothetical protein [Actinotalea sp. Marseille-Q4924]|uniref:hypothetical protein n=1 Tax=Actinotalea sp. Marseille-Q4924 TaxID=2866571 RepID=UPI001CE40AF3|nr:hypothetical protein [Actinotalea sp. Marseille-Q4924]
MTQGPDDDVTVEDTDQRGDREGAQHTDDAGRTAGGADADGGADPGTDADDTGHADDAAQGSAAERLLVEMVLAAPADVAWAALRDPDTIRRWFGWDDDGLGAEIHEIFAEQATADDDARTLTWSDGDRITVQEEAPGQSRLRLVRRGHGAWDGVHDVIDEGWITFTQQLRFLLERHRDDERRTVLAAGLDLGADDDALLDRLGLRSLGDDAVGSRYSVTRPDGSTITGEVFFQTDLQIGLTVEEEDDALLVVSRTPPASAPPHGTVTFLLSLFGETATDEERRAAAEQRWRSWWDGSPAGDGPGDPDAG